MTGAVLTMEEIVQTVRRSSIPTILCEGDQDLQVFRHIEDRLGSASVSFLPCGGRVTLLGVYERKNEFPGAKVVFVADKDMWLFTSVPRKYRGVIFSNGYGIENDLLGGKFVENLLTRDEKKRFLQAIDNLCKWFACEVERFRRGEPYRVNISIYQILADDAEHFHPNFVGVSNLNTPEKELADEILKEYGKKLRGKTLLQLFQRYLSYSTRASKYSKNNIIEICIKLKRNEYMERLISKIRTRLVLG